jgi:hypothetical protein
MLERLLWQTHLRESLPTGDLTAANRKKHAVVSKLKERPADAAKEQSTGLPVRELVPHLQNPQAIREALAELRAAGDEDSADALESVAVDKAREIEAKYGYARAKKWYRAATDTEETLKELQDKWLALPSSVRAQSTAIGRH